MSGLTYRLLSLTENDGFIAKSKRSPHGVALLDALIGSPCKHIAGYAELPSKSVREEMGSEVFGYCDVIEVLGTRKRQLLALMNDEEMTSDLCYDEEMDKLFVFLRKGARFEPWIKQGGNE